MAVIKYEDLKKYSKYTIGNYVDTTKSLPKITSQKKKKEKTNLFNEIKDTIGMGATKIAKGAGSVIEGVADTGAMILKTAGKATSKIVDNSVGEFIFGEDAGDYKNNPLYQIGEKMTNDNVVETVSKPLEDKFEKNSLIKKDGLVSNVLEGVGQVAALAANPAGVKDTALKLGSKTLPIVNSTKTMFMSTLGNSYTRAKQDGADDNDAMLYGLLSAGKETATEAIYGGLGKAFGKGALDDVVKDRVTGMIKNKVGKKAAELGIGMTAEGLEEVASSLFEPLTQRVYKDKEEIDPITFNGLVNDFIGGALVSGVMQGAGEISNLKFNKNNNMLPKASDVQNNNSINNLQNTTVNNTQNLDNEINNQNNYQYVKSDNLKIDNLRKSASQFFNNSNETNNLINSYEKIINDKGYNVLFDNNITNENGMLVNAQIKKLSNGETEIRINPNSERAGEFLIMHEITHAIQTEDMKKLVMDYASKNADFNSALESLKTTYNTSDVSDEVLSDISGQLFGNQEFINELSIKEPNVFRRIYNKIIEIANKITGNSKESLFIKDLKNKWETAYRTQNNVLKPNTKKYMMTGVKGLTNAVENNSNNNWLLNNYNNSQNLKQQGYNNESVRQKTGWFQDKKGDWKFEIDDSFANINSNIQKNTTYKLKNVLTHEDLFEMYPELKEYNVKFDNIKSSGKYNDYEKTIYINNNKLDLNNYQEHVKPTLLHEVQHAIQHIENFTTGTNTLLGKRRYYNNLGEIEATDTAMRANLNIEDRLSIVPESSKEKPLHPYLPYIKKNIDNNNKTKYNKDKEGGINEKNYYESEENDFEDNRRIGSNRNRQNSELSKEQSQTKNELQKVIRDKDERIFRKQELDNSSFSFKQKQLEIIQKSNPAEDEYHTWIRSVNDIKTLEETLNDDEWTDYDEFNPDLTKQDIEKAIKSGKITVYSSYPIKQGIFVSPSKMEAESYSGDGKVYSKEVSIDDVAWIDPTQGQYAKINIKYSQNNNKWQEHLEKNYKATGTRTYLKNIKGKLPTANNSTNNEIKKELPKNPTKEESYDIVDNYTQEISSINNMISNYTNLERKDLISENTYDSIFSEIQKLSKKLSEKDIDNLTNKTFKLLLENKDSKYIATTIYNTINNQRKIKINQYRKQAKEMIDDIVEWNDKSVGLSYQTETMKRNFFDIIPNKKKAKQMYETYIQSISVNESTAKKEINSYNEKIKKLNLNNKESTAVQMYGEYKYNPETTLTGLQVDEFISENKLDYEKIKKSVEVFRNTYDELFSKVNKVLIEQGYKPIEYRKGYFPHFVSDKPNTIIGKFAEKLGWKINKDELPTDIAGMTEIFKPGKRWTSFSQQRKGDATDYNALKGFDTYVRGAMDLIYHTEDIQKLRALENEIRYQYSDKTIQKQIDNINNDEELSTDEKQDKLDDIFSKFNNPMPNFVTELRRYTDGLANKKAIDDRNIEHKANRQIYSTLTNIENRVSANMVGLNVSSAFTNFIPITQGYSQISTKSMLKAIKSTIANQVNNDGFENNSTFLTNRLKNPENLYKTGLDKFNDKASFLFEGVDSITSNILVRGKYYDNINKGMSTVEAMKNADEFAKDVMGGRSKGEMPTIYNEKNPITKLFTSFQLEVKNQYGYMFKDLPRELKDKGMANLIGAFFKMFAGAWLYNKFAETITGRKSAFSPVDILDESLSTVKNENLNAYEKTKTIAKNIAQEIPYVGGLLGGGRLPISSAIPDIKTFEYLANSFSDDKAKKTKAINNLKKELSKPLIYIVLPVGGGQLKKTYEGLSMFSKDKDVKGSYTSSGELRFPVKNTPLSKIQAGIFGQYSSKEAREYFDRGETPLTEKEIKTYKKLNVPITKYWQYRQDLKEVNKIKGDKDENGKTINGSASGKKAYEIMNNKNYSNKEKNYLLSELSSNKETIDTLKMLKSDKDSYVYYFSLTNDSKKDFKDAIKKYDFTAKELTQFNNSIDKTDSTSKKQSVINYLNESNFSDKQIAYLYEKSGYSSEDKLSIVNNSNISIKSYLDLQLRLNGIKGNIDKDGKTIAGSKKKKVLKEINLTAGLSKEQKLLAVYLEGYSIDDGDFTGYTSDSSRKIVFDYVNSLKISIEQKRNILHQAGYKTLKNGRIGW